MRGKRKKKKDLGDTQNSYEDIISIVRKISMKLDESNDIKKDH